MWKIGLLFQYNGYDEIFGRIPGQGGGGLHLPKNLNSPKTSKTFVESANISLYLYPIYVYAEEMLAISGQNSH